jgi:hypothetical protein
VSHFRNYQNLEFIQKFRELKQDFSTHKYINTDGSKYQNKVTSAAIYGFFFPVRLPNISSIFTAEAKALKLALLFIKKTNKQKTKQTNKTHIIHSDSFSCLQAIKNCKTDHPYIYNILKE